MKLEIKPEIKEALSKNLPIVSLESTIITHGMPYPTNVEMAQEVEKVVRKNGAIPATIAIIDGVIKVGLSPEEIEFLGKLKNPIKISKRDFGYVLSEKKSGGTTVSATMIISKLANIKVFATGGIGGVHRNAEKTFDISADLETISETDVLVVCAGAKSILDLGLTLEYLETKGVEVIGYKTDMLPAFYTKESEFKVTYRLDSAESIAELAKRKWEIIKAGIIVANPIPKEFSMPKVEIDLAIEKALEEARKNDIKGKEITPFLLDKIKDITKGRSLKANLALVYNNAELASKIAYEYSEKIK